MAGIMAGQAKKNKNLDFDINGFRAAILRWYDRHGRELPWRVKDGKRADPYAVWLSEIMMQQTTIPMGTPYFLKFLNLWPTVQKLAAAPAEDIMREWAGLGYYARARNLHKCAKLIADERGGKFPDTYTQLLELPGIGPYTAGAISAICFDRPATVVDGNIERVMARVFAITEPLPSSKKMMIQKADALSEGRIDRPGDYAQAMMDLGAMICTPRNPKCGLCPVLSFCAAKKKGIAETLPVRSAKKKKPKKFGYVYFIEDSKNNILFETRPEKGLFGGMAGLPTSEWATDLRDARHPSYLPVKKIKTHPEREVRHSFTHFDLTLIPCRVSWTGRKPAKMDWAHTKNVAKLGLPTLFQKAVKIMK